MRLFFFHIKTNDQLQRDEIGMRCESPEKAYREGYEAIPELAAELLRDGIDPMACELIVEDEAHQRLFTIPFTARLKQQSRPERSARR